MKFDATTLTFSSVGVICSINMIIAVTWYWQQIETFNMYFFKVGLIGSFIDFIGLVSLQTAFTIGPGGPVSALSCFRALILIIIEVVKTHECPKIMEIVGFVIGFLGSIVLVIPEWFKCNR